LSSSQTPTLERYARPSWQRHARYVRTSQGQSQPNSGLRNLQLDKIPLIFLLLILIARFVILKVMKVKSVTPMHHLMIMGSSAARALWRSGA
jgi:hypothetical protein